MGLPRTLCEYLVSVLSVFFTVFVLIFHRINLSSSAITPCHAHIRVKSSRMRIKDLIANCGILVPRGRAPFGQHQESRPLAESNTGSPRFTDFPSLCACSESSLTNLIGSGLNLLCLQSHSKTECRWTRPEVAILGADQKERGLWGRECKLWLNEKKKKKKKRSPNFNSGVSFGKPE